MLMLSVSVPIMENQGQAGKAQQPRECMLNQSLEESGQTVDVTVEQSERQVYSSTVVREVPS